MMDWQPIDSAPLDGTEVLLWRADSGIFFGRWIAPIDFLTEAEIKRWEVDYVEEPDWFYADFVAGDRITDGLPTHWMPLPAPPETTP